MKALIIADNDAMIDVCFATLKKAGYDLIVYRWLLKALDNIEEIAPNIIIIDAISYPRHWKTLVQYTKAISDDKIDFFLFYNNPIFDDEQKKIDFFGIKSVFTSPTFSDFVEYFSHKPKKKAEPIECLFSVDGNEIITGTVSIFDGKMLSFIPDFKLANLKSAIKSKQIENMVIKTLANDEIYTAKADIVSFNSNVITMEIVN